MFVWNVSYPMIQNVLLFFLLRDIDILRLRDLLSYSFKPLYLFILQGLSRKRVYRKIFKGLDWISFVQIKVWKNTSQIRGIKERSFLCHTQHDAFSFQYPTTAGCFYIICQILFKSLLLVGVCVCLFLHRGLTTMQRCLSVRFCLLKPDILHIINESRLQFVGILVSTSYTKILHFDYLKIQSCKDWLYTLKYL